MSDARAYNIDYFYLDGTTWKYLLKPYVNNMILDEGSEIDEVRVYPTGK